MNGIHDMGGMTTFGPVPVEHTSPFHAEWEKRVHALMWAAPDELIGNDEFRHSLERLEPSVYLAGSYHERWLAAMERLFLEDGVIVPEEMAATLPGWGPQPGLPPVRADGDPPPAGEASTPRFSPGDRVRVRHEHPAWHTRTPRYVRDRVGIVDRFLGMQIYPDELILYRTQREAAVYLVRFAARELWGTAASPRDTVAVDLWEDYLLPAGGEERETA